MSKYNYEAGMTLVGGMIEENTYKWIEENLKYAKENNIQVTSFMHHNLLVHNELFKTSYTLYNNQDIVDLLIKYNVKINFSGHLHIQSIKNYTNSSSFNCACSYFTTCTCENWGKNSIHLILCKLGN